MDEDLKKLFHRDNLKVSIDGLGEIEIKYISHADSMTFYNYLNNGLSERDFTCEVLTNQIVNPKIILAQFKLLPEAGIAKIVSHFRDYEKEYFKYYNDTGNIYTDFQLAIRTYREKQFDKIKELIAPQIQAAQEGLKLFSSSFASIIQHSLNEKSYINELLRSAETIGAQIKKANEAAFQMIFPIVSGMENYIKTTSVIINSLQPQIFEWQKWLQQNQNVLIETARHWQAFEQKTRVEEKQAIVILKKYKWFITPGMPFDFVAAVVKMGSKKGRQDKAINDLFIRYFSHNNWEYLEKLVNGWKNKGPINNRWKIIKDCLLTLKKIGNKRINEANVILPTLIAQIDGILSDYLISKGISWDVAYDDYIGPRRIKVGRKSQYARNKSGVLNPNLDNLANDIFLNILFQRSQKGRPLKTPFNFNRHKILHGECVTYGKRDYLVRAFLVIDFLAHLK